MDVLQVKWEKCLCSYSFSKKHPKKQKRPYQIYRFFLLYNNFLCNWMIQWTSNKKIHNYILVLWCLYMWSYEDLNVKCKNNRRISIYFKKKNSFILTANIFLFLFWFGGNRIICIKSSLICTSSNVIWGILKWN